MRVERRIPFYTNPAKRILAKIPNPPPRTMGAPVEFLEGKVRFYDFQSLALKEMPSKLPPILPVSKKLPLMDFSLLSRMRSLRIKSPRYWTISRLSNHFGVHRGFIINQVLTLAEREQARVELEEQIDRMSLMEKRGFLTRYKIREHRRDLM